MKTRLPLFFSALFVGAAWAQSAPEALVLPSVTVSAKRTEISDSSVVKIDKTITGQALRDAQANTIGESVAGELGVHSSGFTAGAARPTLRGLEGARVMMLQNGMGTHDASALSPDHAVGAEVSSARQIEIIKGPAALRFGGAAIGGAVNVVNDRIATEKIEALQGEIDARGTFNTSAGNLRNWAQAHNLNTYLEAPIADLNFHLDGFTRRSENYNIPSYAVKNNSSSDLKTLSNSAARGEGLGIGISKVGAWGYAGASFENLRNQYGIAGSEGSNIRMQQNRFELDGVWLTPNHLTEKLKLKFAAVEYQHTEYDADVAGTTFNKRSLEARADWQHAPVWGWAGTWGLHFARENLRAEGFLPRSTTQNFALYVSEEKKWNTWTASLGARIEKHQLAAFESHTQNLKSASAGLQWAFAPSYQLASNLSWVQRAPTVEERYASGVHEANQSFNLTNPNLNTETARNFEINLAKNSGTLRWKLNLFDNRYQQFIYGRTFDANHDGVADRVSENGQFDVNSNYVLLSRAQANARLRGIEAELSYNKTGLGWNARVWGDMSQLRIEGAVGERANAPLQPPARVGLDWGYKAQTWDANLNLTHAFAHTQVAAYETPTAAYNLLNFAWHFRQKINAHTVHFYVLGKNLLNQEIRLSTSYLKDHAPQQGRSIQIGARLSF